MKIIYMHCVYIFGNADQIILSILLVEAIKPVFGWYPASSQVERGQNWVASTKS